MPIGKNRYAKYGYLFCIPFILAFLIFSFYPIIYTALIGFTDLKGLGKTDFAILENPIQNFQTVLKNNSFQTSLKNTIVIWGLNFVPQILFSLLFAAWFTNRRNKLRGQGAFKVLFYMPNIITAATVAILFATLFGYPKGVINDLLMNLGIIEEKIQFHTLAGTTRGVVAFIQFWMWYGYTMLILISGILGLSPDIFEAAEIDGANGRQTFFRITLPNLRTILIYTLVTSMIGGMQMFDVPRLYQNGGPSNATLTTSLFIYNQAFSGSYMYNRASAASMIMFGIILILSAVIFFLMRDKDTGKKKRPKKAARS